MKPVDYVKPGQPLRASWANDVASRLNGTKTGIRRRSPYMGGSGTGNDATCPFGTLVSGTSAYEITGGVVYAGDKNYNVSNYSIPKATADKLLYFSIPVEVNRDDDGEILLPGIKTSTWSPTWSDIATSSGYPNNTAPDVSDGLGTIIIPIGHLVVTGSTPNFVYNFTPVDCGNITVEHCAGTLSHVRSGGVA